MGRIYLIGMMGSGKSVTGQALAGLLGLPFVDLDSVIVQQEGREINEIFEKDGEDVFRAKESAALNALSDDSPEVVATGGGIVVVEANRERMKKTGKIVYLETALEALWKRVSTSDDRPLLKTEKPKEKLEELLMNRKKLYEDINDFSVFTDGRTAEDVAAEIKNKLGS